MIVAFMLAASSSLATMIAVTCTLAVCVDDEHRVRTDRIYERSTTLRRVLAMAGCALRNAVSSMYSCARKSISVPVTEKSSAVAPTKMLRPHLHLPVGTDSEASGCKTRMTTAIQASAHRLRRGRSYSGHALSEFFTSVPQGGVDMLKQGLPGWRGPMLLSATMLFVPTNSQSKHL